MNVGPTVLRLIENQAEAWDSAGAGARKLDAGERWLFTGSGTSYYLANVASAIGRERGATAWSLPAGDILLNPELALKDADRVFIISRSGDTTEAINAATLAHHWGCATVGITCARDSALARAVDDVFLSPDGEDHTVVMIRSFTSMLVLIQALIDTTFSPAEAPLASLRSSASAVLRQAHALRETLASDVPRRIYLLGAGVRFGIAQEGMLKALEMSGGAAYAYPPLEFRHGPWGSVDADDLVVVLAQAAFKDYELPLIYDLQQRTRRVLVVARESWFDAAASSEILSVKLPDSVRDLWSGPLAVIPLQLIAWQWACSRGADPDHPRNLTQVVRLHEH